MNKAEEKYAQILKEKAAAEEEKRKFGLVDKLYDHGMAVVTDDTLIWELQEKVNELVEEINKMKRSSLSDKVVEKLVSKEVKAKDVLVNHDLVYRVPPETFTVPPTNAELMDKLNELIEIINKPK